MSSCKPVGLYQRLHVAPDGPRHATILQGSEREVVEQHPVGDDGKTDKGHLAQAVADGRGGHGVGLQGLVRHGGAGEVVAAAEVGVEHLAAIEVGL